MRPLTPLLALGCRLTLTLLFAVLAAPVFARGEVTGSVGESIYRRGVLGSGAPLEASREPSLLAAGAEVACVNCHQRSGLGGKEGRRLIPPLAGRYLFRARASASDDNDLMFVDGMRGEREPYTEATLARAIREGIDSEGRPLDVLMPRFALNDTDMASLISYLKDLTPRKLPGVTDTVLHFATIITPEADPVKADGMLDVLEHYFADKNAFPIGATPRLRSSRKMMFMANRHWQLHVWRLTGPPAGWPEQLERHLASEPVLAVVSGQGGATWAPIQSFCEQRALPCLFPNAEAPPADADRDFYSLYFSKGVLLEAGLIANRIREGNQGKVVKVVRQIYRAGDSGEVGARALAAALEHDGITMRSHALARNALGQGVAETLRKSAGTDALVLWLRPGDIARLGKPPDASTVVFMSGQIGGLERSPLPPGWRDVIRVAYPFDLPSQRRVRVDFARGWFAIRHIPVVDEQVQADTYLACGLLAEALSHMADTFVRDYLVERIVDLLEHRVITGYYPRLALAAGQRFASKGGYIVRFSSAAGSDIFPEASWIRP